MVAAAVATVRIAVATLAVSVTSLATRDRLLHVFGVGAAGLVITGWAAAGGWASTALLASLVISGYALAWIAIAARSGSVELAKRGAAVALFVGELTALDAEGLRTAPPQIAQRIDKELVSR